MPHSPPRKLIRPDVADGVKVRHQAEFLAGPFIPRERTLVNAFGMSVSCQEPTWRQIERVQFAGVSGTNALHCTGTTRRTPHHSRCLCSVSLESSSAITVYPIVHALQSKQSDQGDLSL